MAMVEQTPAKSDPIVRIIFVALMALGLMWMCTPNEKDEASSAARQHAGNATDAKLVCQDYVRRRLISPRGAVFARVGREHVDSAGGGVWTVKGELDAPNARGVLLPYLYQCTVRARGDAVGTYDEVQVVVGPR